MVIKEVEVVLLGENPDCLAAIKIALDAMGLELVNARYASIPLECMNEHRNQLEASCVARLVRSLVSFDRVALGIVGWDAYIPGLNFVFGLALPYALVATVYTPRLKLSANQRLFSERLMKEVMHELGHVYGLEHCPNRLCVMSFSNSLMEVDIKKPAFCEHCAAKLAKLGLEPKAVLKTM